MSDAVTLTVPLTLGAVLIGFAFACMLYGCTVLQSYLYLSRFSSPDGRGVKLTILLLWILETLNICFGILYLYDKLILNFGHTYNIGHNLAKEDIIIGISSLTILLARIVYASNIHYISNENWLATGLVIAFSIAFFALEVALMGERIYLDQFLTFHMSATRLMIATTALSIFLDLFIASTLCYYLRARSIGLTSATSLLHKLTLYVLSSGLLGVLVETALLVTFLALPDAYVFLGIMYVADNLYSNAVLSLMNSREALMLIPREDPVKPPKNISFHLSALKSQNSDLGCSAPKTVEVFTKVSVEKQSERLKGRARDSRIV